MRRKGIRGAAGALVVAGLAAACGSSERGRTATSADRPQRWEPPPPAEHALSFRVDSENIANHFFRRGPVAAHLLVTSGDSPRVLVAFPAGNEGIGLWFERPSAPVDLAVRGGIIPREQPDGLRGVTAFIHCSLPTLRTRGVVMTGVRVLRDYTADPNSLPAEIKNEVVPAGGPGKPLTIRRTTLDGGHHFALIIEPQRGATAAMDAQGNLTLAAAPGAAAFDVAMTFLQDDPPLSPIPPGELFTAAASPSAQDRDTLSFLVYREKMLAGSWRFLTYFGRDTLLSVRMLMPALQPAAIEGGLGAVLDRLDPGGEVAHEEDIGEWATLRNLREGRGPKLEPIHDYKMVDDDFMLAPVLAHYLLDTRAGQVRTADFLARRTPAGETYAGALARNLAFVEKKGAAFARAARVQNLVPVKPGYTKGDWRDSDEGIGLGVYAFSINASLVPAALAAAARLHDSKMLCAAGDQACGAREAASATTDRAAAEVWEKKAPGLFRVSIATARAKERVTAYAREQGFDPAAALAAIDGPVELAALSLERSGTPVPVMHSDDGFRLLFNQPPADELDRIARRVTRPFPAGLDSPVGILIANPAFVGEKKRRDMFARDRYHGAVVWSWQQAMLAAGLARQLERTDLPGETRKGLMAAQQTVWKAIRATYELRSSEHWSWEIRDGKFQVFHVRGKEYESNAAQLWSTVYLAVRPPEGMP